MDDFLFNESFEISQRLGKKNEIFNNKTVLITGAFGFLGKHFLSYFIYLSEKKAFNIKIIAIDNFIRGNNSLQQQVSSFPNLTVMEVDIINQKSFPDADYIIHAASIASPIYYRKYPIETLDANVNGYRNLLEYYKNLEIESMLYFSTSEIYGDPPPSEIPTKESFRGLVSCTGPRACYDESKRLGETMSVLFHEIYGLPIKIARPFNNYGPGLNIKDKRVIPDFFNDILSNRNIILYSDGSATRTFCYIQDAIFGYILLLISDLNADPVNIGSSKPEISMFDLAEKCINVSGKNDLKIKFEKNPDSNYLSDNPNRRCPDLSKANTELGYSPSISLEDGLSRSFEYYLMSSLK